MPPILENILFKNEMKPFLVKGFGMIMFSFWGKKKFIFYSLFLFIIYKSSRHIYERNVDATATASIPCFVVLRMQQLSLKRGYHHGVYHKGLNLL